MGNAPIDSLRLSAISRSGRPRFALCSQRSLVYKVQIVSNLSPLMKMMSIFQGSLQRPAFLVLVAGLSGALTGCGPHDGKVDFVAEVTSTHPIAYYRLDATSGASEVGSSKYTASGGATSSASDAPINVPDNKCIVLDGKNGWITTTQSGGVTSGGSILAWINLAGDPAEGRRPKHPLRRRRVPERQ